MVGFHLNRQAVQLVMRDSAVEFNGVLQLLHRHVKTFEKQSPGLPGNAQRLKAPGILTGTGKAQLNALGHHLLHAGADETAQMLTVAEHFNAIRRRSILMHFTENGFQRFDHRLLAVKVQGAHFVPRVAVQQIDATD